MTKKLIGAVGIIAALLLSGCASEQGAGPSTGTSDKTAPTLAPVAGSTEVPAALAEPLEIALVTRITTGSWYETYHRALEAQVESLGGSVQVYDSANDLAKMASNVDTAVNAGVDAILINNGTAEALDASVAKALTAGIQVVAYDSDIALDGVTSINQDDYLLSWNGLRQLATDFNGEANIVTLSVAGFLPLDRRSVIVEAALERFPGITEVARAGNVSGSTALDTQAQVEALLRQYPEPGQIDAIWSHWNEFTRGALEALKQAGRTDIAVYTVDLTDQEIGYFWDDSVNFVAASATNPGNVGAVQARLAYQKVAGETVGNDVLIDPSLITRAILPDEAIGFDELDAVAPGWSSSDAAVSAWMATLEAAGK